MVSTGPYFSKSSSLFINPLGIVASALTTSGITVTFIIAIITIIILHLAKFFSPALTDGLSVDSKLQEVTSGLQEFCQYSSWSQQCCFLDGLDSCSDFQLF